MFKSDNSERRLTCVLFPGVVKNDERAIECLGGIRAISQVYSQNTKKRLGLAFQPENPLVKRIYGDPHKTAGVLLKVKVVKTKIGNEIKKEVLSTEIIGRVSSIYKFEAMCDFQYLPVERDGTGPVKCCLEKVIPSGLETFDFMSEPSPLIIVPPNFTRTDKPNCYAYTEKKYYISDNKTDPLGGEDNVHNRTRSVRKGQFNAYEFSLTNEMPIEPHELSLKQKNLRMVHYPQLEDEYETIKKLFDERPIWSFNLLRYETKIKPNSLKLILPCLGFYMRKGPWKMMWNRFGYDPRKDPASRKYQTLDFRVRSMAGINAMVTKREEYQCKKGNEPEDSKEDIPRASVIFEPGLVPTQRQVYYQYCDIKLEEVEALVSPEPAPGYLCHPARGWLLPHTDRACRDLVFKYVKQTLLATHNADIKFEEGSSDDEGSDFDDTIASATAEEII